MLVSARADGVADIFFAFLSREPGSGGSSRFTEKKIQDFSAKLSNVDFLLTECNVCFINRTLTLLFPERTESMFWIKGDIVCEEKA